MSYDIMWWHWCAFLSVIYEALQCHMTWLMTLVCVRRSHNDVMLMSDDMTYDVGVRRPMSYMMSCWCLMTWLMMLVSASKGPYEALQCHMTWLMMLVCVPKVIYDVIMTSCWHHMTLVSASKGPYEALQCHMTWLMMLVGVQQVIYDVIWHHHDMIMMLGSSQIIVEPKSNRNSIGKQ